MKIFQKGFNFSQDGPGNRLVYHLQGCNMRCIWCSNPEGMSMDGGREYSPSEIADEAVRSRMMFFGGGGVTFTGGEATVQFDELSETLSLLKEAGINTAIETNGTSPHLKEILPLVDYLIMDFKHYDSGILKEYTGVGNEPITKNFEEISASGRQLHIRIPLINGFNADCPEKFAEYFAKHKGNTVFEFLPYHEYGRDKWTEEYHVTDGFVTDETVKRFAEVFGEYGLKVIET